METKYLLCLNHIVFQVGLVLNLLFSQVETIDDYDEYCHYVAGVIAQAISKLSHACGLEDLAPDNLSNSVGLFIQVLPRPMGHIKYLLN